MKKLISTITIILGLSSLAACGVNEESYYGYRDEGTNGQVNRTKNVNIADDDSPRKLTGSNYNVNQNPNFLNMSEERPTLGTDIDKAREVVDYYTDYQPDEVWINGDNMWVTAHTREKLRGEKLNDEEAKLKKILVRALPRYDINVRISER